MRDFKAEYAAKLKDPRWQRKRLEVFNVAGFLCERCSAGDKTLHAHHTYYTPDTDPWDYPPGAIICLCEPCHEAAHGRGDAQDVELVGDPPPLRSAREVLLTSAWPFVAEIDRGLWNECRDHTCRIDTLVESMRALPNGEAYLVLDRSLLPLVRARKDMCDAMTEASRRLMCSLFEL